MCLHPTLVKNPKYKVTKKNGGNVPVPSDNRALWLPVGCGDCMECRKQKAREWKIRLAEEIKTNKNGIFVTLTFTNEEYTKLLKEIQEESKEINNNLIEGYDLDNEICKKATRRFYERYRKKYKKTLRHWLITELGHGETEHIHMHGIVWVEPEKYIVESKTKGIVQQQKEFIEKYWQYGGVWVGDYVSERTINYMTKYVTKVDADHKYYKSKILASKGIGAGYINTINAQGNKFKGEKTVTTYRTKSGHKMSLPIYYRNKIYTEEEREKLWMMVLDKEERFVNKQRIDISESEQEYYNALKYAQELNKAFGYGSGEIDWKRKKYEKLRRIAMQKKREKAASPVVYGGEEEEQKTEVASAVHATRAFAPLPWGAGEENLKENLE